MDRARVLSSESEYPVLRECIPRDARRQGPYLVRFARSDEDLDAVLRLRYEVFNLELGEGLEESHRTGRDRDDFDPTCHHLLVTETTTGRAIGTYRMQTAEMAARHRGFYSAGEFDLGTLPPEVVAEAIEVGRACVGRPHRNRSVLFLLWTGLASYMAWNRKRFLFGCCSLRSQNPAEGHRMLRHLTERGHLHPSWRVRPRPGWECEDGGRPGEDAAEVVVPPLFATYLRYGARVCSPPVIDREFKTIDFFVVLDVQDLPRDSHRVFFGSSSRDR